MYNGQEFKLLEEYKKEYKELESKLIDLQIKIAELEEYIRERGK